MSILIKMEMPTNCCQCPVNMEVCKRGYKYLLTHPELYDKRADDCPLIEIPPHGDLIERDALRASIRESIEECHKWVDEVDKDTMMYARISQSLGTFVECSLRAKAAPTIIEEEEGE